MDGHINRGGHRMSHSQQSEITTSILIVEDSRSASNIIARMVAMHFPDAVVYTAYNGKTGVELFKKYAPNIVITDIIMPEMDGIQMAIDIKSIRSETKFIVFTASTDGHFLEQLSHIGVHSFLLKPFDLNELMMAIEKCIEDRTDISVDLIPDFACYKSIGRGLEHL